MLKELKGLLDSKVHLELRFPHKVLKVLSVLKGSKVRRVQVVVYRVLRDLKGSKGRLVLLEPPEVSQGPKVLKVHKVSKEQPELRDFLKVLKVLKVIGDHRALKVPRDYHKGRLDLKVLRVS